MEDRTTMKNQQVTRKSKLHCQSCDTKLTFQKIASNLPLTPPSLYAKSDSTVLSSDKLGRPIYVTINDYVASANEETALLNSQWSLFMRGMLGGLVLFAVIISLFLMSPYSKLSEINAEVYLEPIMRLGEVEIIRLDNTENKNADIEVALLEDPKKAPEDLVWEEVGGRVSDLARDSVQPATLIQEDLLSTQLQTVIATQQDTPPDLTQPVKTILEDLDRLLKN